MTATHTVHVRHTYTSDPATVFSAISEHENLEKVLPVTIKRVRDGDTERNGVGSTRSMRPFGFGPAFHETNTLVEPNSRIEYTVTKGGPLRDHQGTITVEPTPTGGTTLDWRITFGSAIPGVAALMQRLLTKSITKGLPSLTA